MMGKTIKAIDHMSIHHPYACLGEDRYITLRHVNNQKEVRLSRSEGNVNLTDFWFSILDNLAGNNRACSCQNIALLSDIPAESDTDWWVKQDGNRICIGFLKIASKSGLSVKEAMDKLEGIIGDNGKLFRTLDNADIILVVSMQQWEERQFRSLVKDVITCRHNDKEIYFSRFVVYGTGRWEKDYLKIENMRIATGYEKFCAKHQLWENGWCNALMNEMVYSISEYKKQKNKKMMSYYQALLQILSVLGQYEQEMPHKDLFYIFYPPITLFSTQLKETHKKIEKIEKEILSDKYDSKMQKLQEKQIVCKEMEKAISQFLDTMELLMHHIGQSCEDVIGETGHGGMPYDIPLRIILMYIAFLNILSDVLVEDGTPKKEFEYCLSPLAFTQSATMGFNVGDMEKGRLIRVKMPRHMLFMPRPFLVILAHEVSHYAHESSRMRPDRAKCMRKIAGYVIFDMLIGNNVSEIVDACTGEEYEILHEYLTILSQNLQKYLENAISEKTEYEGGENPQKYYLDNFTDLLQETCYEILYDADRNLRDCVNKIDDRTINVMRDIKKYPKLYEKITKIQQEIVKEAEYAAYKETLSMVLNNWKKAFREIYADLSAIRVLGLSWDDYIEAYILSESCQTDLDDIQPELLNRFAMVKYILTEKETEGWSEEDKDRTVKNENGWNNIQKMKEPIQKYEKMIKAAVQKYTEGGEGNASDMKIEENAKRIVGTENDWFYCEAILSWEVEFFKECDDSLERYIKGRENENEKKLEKLRNFYKSFDVNPQNEDGSFVEFFDAFDELTRAYKDSVNEKYRMFKTKLAESSGKD